jgi:hypothetical protein
VDYFLTLPDLNLSDFKHNIARSHEISNVEPMDIVQEEMRQNKRKNDPNSIIKSSKKHKFIHENTNSNDQKNNFDNEIERLLRFMSW